MTIQHDFTDRRDQRRFYLSFYTLLVPCIPPVFIYVYILHTPRKVDEISSCIVLQCYPASIYNSCIAGVFRRTYVSRCKAH